jgi:hypothetical protein
MQLRILEFPWGIIAGLICKSQINSVVHWDVSDFADCMNEDATVYWGMWRTVELGVDNEIRLALTVQPEFRSYRV